MNKVLKNFLFFIFIFTFFCKSEPKQIRFVNFSGNKFLNNSDLMSLIRQKPKTLFYRRSILDTRLLKMDALTIENYYKSFGFLEVVVKENHLVDGNSADTNFSIKEGIRYFISSISVTGNSIFTEDEILNTLDLSAKNYFNPIAINENIISLENKYHEIGHLFASFDIKTTILDSIDINVIVDEGRIVSIKDIIIDCTQGVDSSIVFRELKISKNSIYNSNSLNLSKKRLRETGIFSMINMIPVKVKDSDSLVNIVIALNKFKQREWLSVGGYEPFEFYEGTEPLPALGGFIEWSDRAIFNTGTKFSTKILAGVPLESQISIPRLRYDISLDNNWIISQRWPSKITGFYETLIDYQEESIDRIERYGLELVQKVKFKGRSYFQNGAVWENFSDKDKNKNFNQINQNLEQRSISARYHLDLKDNALFPRKGVLIDIYFKSTGYILGGERDFKKVDFSIQMYLPLSKKSVLAHRIKLGRLWSWDTSNNDFSYEKFYLGGSTSMRGWDILRFEIDESGNPQGKIYRALTNTELRTPISNNIALTYFFDGGILSDKIELIVINNFKWNGGIGIAINTPLGPARLDYAIPLDSEEKGKIQLGVQYLF